MNRILACSVALVLLLGCTSGAAEPKLETDQDKTFYALGIMISTSLTQYRLTEAELELVKAGLTDGVLGRDKKVDADALRGNIQELARSRAAAAAEDNKKAGKAFVDNAVAKDGAVLKEGGMAIKTLQEGAGQGPAAEDTVKVHYTGTLIDGTVFDSSVQRGQPATFALNRVIKCWTSGVQLMKPGGKARLYCPSDTAYGDQGRPSIPPGATLVFDVELLEVTRAATAQQPVSP
jgi:FKBP-type peptidyl-prolyl cis-trans isomerase FkpA/FKBP-type peptidyl-prolyl cis-trans isomerase FklB